MQSEGGASDGGNKGPAVAAVSALLFFLVKYKIWLGVFKSKSDDPVHSS